MRSSTSFFVAGIFVGALATALACALIIRPKEHLAKQGQLVIKLAHGLEESHPVHKAMLFMSKRVEELTDGQAMLDVYGGGVLGNETDCLEQVQKGELAMTKVSIAVLEAFLPNMKVFSVPYLFRDAEHFWNTLTGPIGDRMLEAGVENRFRGLCYYDSGDRNFYTTKKAVRTVEDVKGMKVRVLNSRTAIDMIRAMGGSPCPISWGELYTALSQGTVDAAENNPPSFITSRHYEVCKYFIFTRHQRIPDMLIINTAAWDKLPPNVQAAMNQAAKESETFQRELWIETTESSLTKARESGVEIIEPDMESFRKACAPIVAGGEYQGIQDLIAEIKGVK